MGSAIAQGWKPIELAQQLGVAPSFLSELLGELRTVLGFVNGVFPTPSEDEYRALLESVAEHGVQVPIVMDGLGVIDGHQRLRACRELAYIVDAADALPEWRRICDAIEHDRAEAVEMYGRDQVEQASYLAGIGGDLIDAARARRWADPPIDERKKLGELERRRLVVLLNAPRRHLSRGETRLLVEVEIMDDKARGLSRNNQEIARLVGCSGEYVRQVRAQLAADEELFANPQAAPEVQVLVGWKPVAEIECPHCSYHLALERAGREFRLELTAGA